MCQGCDDEVKAVAEITGLPVEVVAAVRNAYRLLAEAEEEAYEEAMREARPFNAPEAIGEDPFLTDAFVRSLVNGGVEVPGVVTYVIAVPADEGDAS